MLSSLEAGRSPAEPPVLRGIIRSESSETASDSRQGPHLREQLLLTELSIGPCCH